MITGSVHGIKNVAQLLNKTLPGEVQKELASGVKDEAQQLASVMRMGAPSATGQLRAAITVQSRNKGMSAKIGVFSALRGFVARFLVFGVKAHEIFPKNRKALFFAGRYVSSIKHPGMHADDFILAPTQDARTGFQARMRDALINALRSVNK